MADIQHKTAGQPTVTVRVRVQPRGSRSEIQVYRNGLARIKTTAAPADGQANADVASQLVKAYAVPASRITLVRGATIREKVLQIAAPGSRPEFPTLDAPSGKVTLSSP